MQDDQNDQQTADAQASQGTQQATDDQSTTPSAESDQSAASQSGGGDRAAARAAMGLPSSPDQLSAEQLHAYLSEPTVEAEDVNADQVEVLAMQDTGSESGEAVA
jgi:hypothetical protein